MSQVRQQRKRGDDQKRQGGEQREPVGRLHFANVENPLERGQDESPGHQPRDVGIDHHQQAPLQFDFVGIDVPLDLLEDVHQRLNLGLHGYLTSPSRLA